jgi:protein-tyrosine-phosphatase
MINVLLTLTHNACWEHAVCSRLHLLLNFAEDELEDEVPDPYYVGNFERIYRLVEAGCRGLLEHIRNKIASESNVSDVALHCTLNSVS